jgi:hypothetical protein
MLRVYYRQCYDKSVLAIIQFNHCCGTTPFFAIRHNPHTPEPGMVVELRILSFSKKNTSAARPINLGGARTNSGAASSNTRHLRDQVEQLEKMAIDDHEP